MSASPEAEHPTTRALRRFLFTILLLGILGALAELYLLGHYEEWWQLTPLVLLGSALPVLALCLASPSAASLKLLRGLMLAFVVAGAIGVYQHYAGNAEFELEMYPSRAGFELFWESLAGATPALAPASLSWLGLIGLAYCLAHSKVPRRR